MEGGKTPTLHDGFYKVEGNWYQLLQVEGNIANIKLSMMGDMVASIDYGDFGEADPEIQEITGISDYNLEITCTAEGNTVKELGVITKEGVRLATKSMMGGVAIFEKISKEEAIEMENDGDPIDAPPSSYKVQPEHQGRILWFTGPSGLGKSTTAQLLARNHEYVYYEADCFNACKNPYVPVDAADPSLAQINQKQLKGAGLEKRKEAIGNFMTEYGTAGKERDEELFKEYLALLCDDIEKEKSRLGGDWAVAMVVQHRKVRDFIRARLGPSLVFIVLEMNTEDMMERLRKRHKGDETAVETLKTTAEGFEAAGEDEENTIGVTVAGDMSLEDVVNKTIELLKNNQ